MDDSTLTDLTDHWPLLVAGYLAVAACLGAWAAIIVRYVRRRSMLSLARRRPVPWGGLDVLGVLVLFIVVNSATISLACWAILPPANGERADAAEASAEAADNASTLDGSDPRAEQSPPTNAEEGGRSDEENDEIARLHPAIRLLAKGDIWIGLLCAFGVVVVAPICEEFMFRVLLQGWLEAVGWRLRGAFLVGRRVLPGAVPILITALLFGSVHYNAGDPQREELLLPIVAADAVAKPLAMLLAIWLVRWRVGATAADFGWEPRRLLPDVGLGLAAFAAVAAPIYAMKNGLSHAISRMEGYVPENLTADPFVLVFFGAALGILYFRTHRIVPAIVLHMALNATSLAMLLYMLAM